MIRLRVWIILVIYFFIILFTIDLGMEGLKSRVFNQKIVIQNLTEKVEKRDVEYTKSLDKWVPKEIINSFHDKNHKQKNLKLQQKPAQG